VSDPVVPAYLDCAADRDAGGFMLELEAYILTPRMRENGSAPARLSVTRFADMYWTFAQMLTHHASNGCSMRPGDVLGSGTASGASDDSRGCFAELSEFGTRRVGLPGGESRSWIEDGDELILRGRAVRAGYVSIGFGECRARLERHSLLTGAHA
jgi:fumarylacetoacetase